MVKFVKNVAFHSFIASYLKPMHKINPDPDFEKLSKHLFWDVDRSKLSFDRNPKLVVQRVLEYGLLEDWIIIRDYYGVKQIAEVAMTLRDLDPISANFIATLANQPIEKFRCYIWRQSHPTHWVY